MLVFVVLNVNGNYTKRIANAVERKGYQTKIISWRLFDDALVRKLDPGNDVIFLRTGALPAIKIAREFEDAGFLVLNDSRYVTLSAQKFLANVHARTSGIAVPALNVCIPKNNIDLLLLHLRQNGPLVAKPIISRDMGRYVYRIASPKDSDRVLCIPGSHILLQSEIRFTRLVRAIVTRESMLAEATTYEVKRSSWKVTVCENPHAAHYKCVPSELIAISERTIKAFGGEIAYIDYFETSDGFVLNEINHSCSLREQEQISGCPIAERLGDYLAARLRQSKTGISRSKARTLFN